MKLIYRMAVRNMLPEVFNEAAHRVARQLSAEEHPNVDLKKVTESPDVPTEG